MKQEKSLNVTSEQYSNMEFSEALEMNIFHLFYLYKMKNFSKFTDMSILYIRMLLEARRTRTTVQLFNVNT